MSAEVHLSVSERNEPVPLLGSIGFNFDQRNALNRRTVLEKSPKCRDEGSTETSQCELRIVQTQIHPSCDGDFVREEYKSGRAQVPST